MSIAALLPLAIVAAWLGASTVLSFALGRVFRVAALHDRFSRLELGQLDEDEEEHPDGRW